MALLQLLQACVAGTHGLECITFRIIGCDLIEVTHKLRFELARQHIRVDGQLRPRVLLLLRTTARGPIVISADWCRRQHVTGGKSWR